MNGHYLASAACGLQNVQATTYSGPVICITHVTGIFTDLGGMIGAKFRVGPFDKRKGLLVSLIIVGFIVGGSLGAYLFELFKFQALYIPALICVLLTLPYSLYNAKPAN